MVSRFSSPRANKQSVAVPHRDTSTIEDPVEEFHYMLDRLGCLIDLSKEAYEEALKLPAAEKPSLGFFRRNRKKDKSAKDEDEKETEDINTAASTGTIDSTPDATDSSSEKNPTVSSDAEQLQTTPAKTEAPEKMVHSPPPSLSSRSGEHKSDASFIPIVEEDECVEIVRRIAELVIISERVVATQMAKEDEVKKYRAKKGWGDNITEDSADAGQAVADPEAGSEAYTPIFDLFFERNGLGLIVDILVGEAFQLFADAEEGDAVQTRSSPENPNSGEGEDEVSEEKEETNPVDTPENATELSAAVEGDPQYTTNTRTSEQEVESDLVETLRCTTLLPSLKIATQAVQSVSMLVQNVARATSLYFVLSNNYVNALIDLPLDLYASAEQERQTMLGNPPTTRLKTYTTPELGELSTHYCTFLKSLAMRMNTETLQFYLKYPTLSIDQEEDADEETRARAIEFPLYARALDFCAAHHDSFVRVTAMNICLNTLRLTTVTSEGWEEDAKAESVGSSPDGVLHNASPLPFRERFAIATHTCAPSRVDKLVAPIVTKLSNVWCSLQERFMDLDTHPDEDAEKPKKGTTPDPAKERERKHSAFKEAANSLQDQLLLLDDLLKVGLTALNEQIIEMMFAMFVYPLLLQPLIVYYQQLATDSDETPPLQDPFTRRVEDRSTVDFSQVGRAPAHITAPAKTALFTLAAVFHLISNRPFLRLLYTALFHPLSPDSSGETVISAEGCVTEVVQGKKIIRLDILTFKGGDERQAYPFGGKEEASSAIDHNDESCVFVLSPALAKVLMYKGGPMDGNKTRPNPYRRAILQCLEVPHHMSDFRKLAFNTVDAALTFFDGEFLVDTLLGNDFLNANRFDCDHEKLREEVVSALCDGLINGKPGPFGTWKLQFDLVASHALLCAVWKSPKAIAMAAQIVEQRFRKAAVLLSEIPARIPTTQHLGSIMNLVFFEAASKRRKATFSELFCLKSTAPERFSTAIAMSASFRSLCNRSFEAPPATVHLNKFTEHTAMDLGSSSCRAILKLDALSTFLNSISKDNAQIEGVPPAGFALTSDRGIISTRECFIEDLRRSIHSYLSPSLCSGLTGHDNMNESDRPAPGSIVALAGRSAMPCVCEAPANSVISNSGAKMVVEGVIWQSLYLAFFGSYLVLAEPAPGSAGQGRVVTACPLSRITVARDPNPPADPSSPARRLLMAYKWFDTTAPSLFIFDEVPKVEEYGPFNKVKLWRCKLDIWFEDEDSAAHAYHSIHFQIDKSKTLRGDSILDFLTQAE